jgi:protein AATF/BFR2
VGRDALDDDDSDDPFSRGFLDEENSEEESEDGGAQLNGRQQSSFKGFSSENEEVEDDESEDEDMDTFDKDEDDDINSEDGDDEDEEEHARPRLNGITGPADAKARAELLTLSAADQKGAATTLAQGAKSDAEKGQAVKKQRQTFDSLLNIRIKLQKALIATNSFAVAEQNQDETDAQDVMKAAEEAAVKLWNNLNALRNSIETTRTGKKRKFAELFTSSPIASFWQETNAHEASARPLRDSTLDFWSSKCRPTTVQSQRGRLNAAAQQTLSDVLAGQLADTQRLVSRTQVARSCAPLQAAKSQLSKSVTLEQESSLNALPIYDDADFYGVLLQNLISQRSADATSSLAELNISSQPWQIAREAKTKKQVDTRASKGRKLRYTVHEKLQNFMAPEDRSSWGDRQCDELFGSLFGRRIELGENAEEENEDDRKDYEMGGLRLFATAT